MKITPEELMEKVDELIDELAYLSMDWSDLGWDSEGSPDGDLCDAFEEKLSRIKRMVENIDELRRK